MLIAGDTSWAMTLDEEKKDFSVELRAESYHKRQSTIGGQDTQS